VGGGGGGKHGPTIFTFNYGIGKAYLPGRRGTTGLARAVWRCRQYNVRRSRLGPSTLRSHDVLPLRPNSSSRRPWRLGLRQGAGLFWPIRGLDAATQLQIRPHTAIRCSRRFALKEHLAASDVPVEDMIEAGCWYIGDISNTDIVFATSVMFPIGDFAGRSVHLAAAPDRTRMLPPITSTRPNAAFQQRPNALQRSPDARKELSWPNQMRSGGCGRSLVA